MKNINIHAFAKQFAKEYNFLYDNCDNVAGYREAAAFAFALEAVGALD